MKNWKPWEYLLTRDYGDSEAQNVMNSFTNANPFPAVFDRFDDAKHGPGPRKASAGVHPETK